MLKAHLAMAERHVAEGEVHIRHQKEIVAQLQRDGHDVTTAAHMLAVLEGTQKLHVADRDRLRRLLAEAAN
jgi:hypothetical protein